VLDRDDVAHLMLDSRERANTLLTELRSLERIVRLAVQQHPEKWPKGMSWN
jgi:hypothetical protein